MKKYFINICHVFNKDLTIIDKLLRLFYAFLYTLNSALKFILFVLIAKKRKIKKITDFMFNNINKNRKKILNIKNVLC